MKNSGKHYRSAEDQSMRFWAHVNKTGKVVSDDLGACWEWTGVLSNGEYGYFRLYGSMVFTHKHAWETENGKIPHKIKVCHKCDNPKCVRLSHLFLGTQQDNVHDMIRKGRSVNVKGIERLDPPHGTTWCYQCEKYLPLEDFYHVITASSYNRTSSGCKKCHSEKMRIAYYKNKLKKLNQDERLYFLHM